jgi:hypothetical protein
VNPDEVSLWITSFRRQEALHGTVSGWLRSFPFEEVHVIANDPGADYSAVQAQWPQVKIWRNVFRSQWETGSIAWCWNQAMRHTFETRRWCLMSQDDVAVAPGWPELVTDDYDTYVAPHGDTVQLQSLAGFNAVGWFDERFRAIGGPEADYLLRCFQAIPERLSAHDEHGWQWRHNDVGLADYWRGMPKTGEVGATRAAYNEKFADAECFARWNAKWGEHVDSLMTHAKDAQRQGGWDEIDWYPSFTRRLRELGRA